MVAVARPFHVKQLQGRLPVKKASPVQRDEEAEKKRKKQGNFKDNKTNTGETKHSNLHENLPIISGLSMMREDYQLGVLWEMETASPGQISTA
jgi:hypothetical protein